MITLRPSNERGHANHGWLDSYHTFSFANYYDPEHMGFRALRVINEDRVAAGRGFGTHPHRDMEIISYVLSGSLAHKDSMGNAATITTGEVQRITAGTGIAHSEFNPSDQDPVHFLQIWILPDTTGLPPSYDEKSFPTEVKQGQWRQMAGHNPADGAVHINQDVDLYATVLTEGETRSFELRPDRYAWVQVAQGKITLNGQSMEAGDGAAVSDKTLLELQAHSDAEVLLFDLA
ncbi:MULTISPECIES: pirin family protein [unclassified Leptolyngbya]|uniref:pirin family protein n=1 Tax=unclassified Leptolyngbya TaxID=2650499 RepID=UPI0016871581|nr:MULTISPECIES: pirin family protein [unclassified Leptolyngbya]MBD1913672.1 pirin family protein [Leptolyngbya sp. FACHB-8]MBD2157052.1 pirin family protein [Leptolyngbya sp. FACHB-16]